MNTSTTQKNNWYPVCSDWFSDALILKNGYAYAYWDDSTVTESELYENLTDDAFALLSKDKEIEIVGHDQRPNEDLNERNQAAYQQAVVQYQQMAGQYQQMLQAQQTPQMSPGMAPQQPQNLPPPPQQPPPAFLHDVELKRIRKRGQVKLCTLAPERCLIDVNTPNHTLEGADYFEWFEWKTIGELRAAGLDVPDDVGDDSGGVIDGDENWLGISTTRTSAGSLVLTQILL